VRKGPNPKLIVPAKIFLEDVTGETSKRLPEEETIPNDHLVIQSCSEGDDIEQKAVSSSELESEESTFNTESEGSDSCCSFSLSLDPSIFSSCHCCVPL
jgi:hypothetical protein